jgi:hypothetical protein
MYRLSCTLAGESCGAMTWGIFGAGMIKDELHGSTIGVVVYSSSPDDSCNILERWKSK